MAGIAGIVFMLLGIIGSIALHELGHLWPAKRFRALVPEYMIGFGPVIFQKQIGETVYGFKGILLGGYCKILGMYGPAKPGQKIYRLGWRRLNLEEYQQLEPAQQAKVKETLAQEAREASMKEIPTGEVHRAYFNLPVRHKLAIIFGGPIMNLLISVCLTFVAMCGVGVAAPTTEIAKVVCFEQSATDHTNSDQSATTPNPDSANNSIGKATKKPAISAEVAVSTGDECVENSATKSPAAAAGLKNGDVIRAWDGEKITDWQQVREHSRATKGSAILTVERDGKEETIKVDQIAGHLGVVSALKQQRQSPVQAVKLIKEQFVGTAAVVVRLPQAVWDVSKALVTGEERDKSGVMSIIGASRIAGEVADAGQTTIGNRISALLMLLASLNMALFVFNLIPLPPLDGGHIAGAAWQGIKQTWARMRGRPVPGPVDAAAVMPLTYLVVTFFVLMTVVLFVADIVKPIRLFG